MATEGHNTGRLLLRTLTALFPEWPTLPAGEGVLLKFAQERELHLNVTRKETGSSMAMLALFTGAGEMQQEMWAYEINLQAHSAAEEVVRGATDKPLLPQLMGLSKLPVQGRSAITPTGTGDVNASLFQRLTSLFPEILDDAGRSSRRRRSGPEIKILSNEGAQMSLEISRLGHPNYYSMDVRLDKARQTASVVAVSGRAGRYPSYLAYPDGVEMTPEESYHLTFLASKLLNAQTNQKKQIG